MKVIILHDNPEWFQPLQDAFAEYNIPTEEWISDETAFDVTTSPPEDAIFYNRSSSSSHTRGHRYSLEQARAICRWLEDHNRVVINGLAAVELEESKTWQYVQAQKYGIPVPKTIITSKLSPELIASEFGEESPFVIKPDRGGKGVFVSQYDNLEEFIKETDSTRDCPNGMFLVQKYLPSSRGVFRVEYVGGKLLYVSRVKLPATCFSPNMCPCELSSKVYQILTDFEDPVLAKFEAFLEGTGLQNCAFEFIYGEDGQANVYDINTNTAYNEKAEKRAGIEEGGFRSTVRYLVDRLLEERNKRGPAER